MLLSQSGPGKKFGKSDKCYTNYRKQAIHKINLLQELFDKVKKAT